MCEKVIWSGDIGQGRPSRDYTLRASDRIFRVDPIISGRNGKDFSKSN